MKKVIEGINRRHIFLIVLVYSLAYGLMLLNDGIFLDDWVLYHIDKTIVMSTMSEMGLPWLGYYNILMLSLDNMILDYMIVSKILVFFCYLFAAIFLYGTLKTIEKITPNERFFITIFFAIFPVNSARIGLFTSHYAVSYFIFFLGFFLLSRYFIKRNIVVRLFALIMFFLSFFSLQSLLVFYGIVILFIAYAEYANIKTAKGLIFVPLKYFDFIILPLVFWLLRNIAFMAKGGEAGYNSISLQNLMMRHYNFADCFYYGFIDPLKEAFQYLNNHFLLTIIVIFLAGTLVYKAYFSKRNDEGIRDLLFLAFCVLGFLTCAYAEVSVATLLAGIFVCKAFLSSHRDEGINDLFFLMFGVFAFFAGVYAYMAVGKGIGTTDFNTRNQMLVPLGSSFILFYFVKIIFNTKARSIVCSLLIVLFVYTNFMCFLEFQRDWFKQLSLIENFKDSDVVKHNTTFLLDDKTKDINARKREHRFYEINGLMKVAFGDEKRLGIPKDKFSVSGIKYFENFVGNRDYRYFNMNEYTKLKQPEYTIIINHGTFRWSVWGNRELKLLLKRLFFPERFKKDLRTILTIQTVKN